MTWLKFNESTRNLAGSKSVSEHEVQYDLTQIASMPEFELLVCSMHRFKGNKVPQGVQAGRAQEQGITKGDAWKGAQATLWMVLGGWGSG